MKIEKVLISILSVLLLIAIIGLFKIEAKLAMFMPKYTEGLKAFNETKTKLFPIAEAGRIILNMNMKKGVLKAKAEAQKVQIVSNSIAKGYNDKFERKFLVRIKYTGDETLDSVYVKLTFYDKNKEEVDVLTDSLSGINAFQKGEASTGFLIYRPGSRSMSLPTYDSYKVEIFKVEIVP